MVWSTKTIFLRDLFHDCVSQIDYIWFYKYLPSKRRQLKRYKLVADRANEMVTKRIRERRENMKQGDETSDFISAYLSEVDKSGGKLQDKCVFLF